MCPGLVYTELAFQLLWAWVGFVFSFFMLLFKAGLRINLFFKTLGKLKSSFYI